MNCTIESVSLCCVNNRLPLILSTCCRKHLSLIILPSCCNGCLFSHPLFFPCGSFLPSPSVASSTSLFVAAAVYLFSCHLCAEATLYLHVSSYAVSSSLSVSSFHAAIDEADRLLDLGFLDAIKSIVSSFPSSRQTLVFSATLNSAVHRLGLLLCSSNPEAICTDNSQQQQQLLLKQTYMVLQAKHKTSALFSILRAQCKKKILVFVSSCKQTKFIHDAFKLLKPG